MALKSELQIRKKAMQCDDFPSEEIIDEFMQDPIDMSPLQLDWSQPNLVKFVVSYWITNKRKIVIESFLLSPKMTSSFTISENHCLHFAFFFSFRK